MKCLRIYIITPLFLRYQIDSKLSLLGTILLALKHISIEILRSELIANLIKCKAHLKDSKCFRLVCSFIILANNEREREKTETERERKILSLGLRPPLVPKRLCCYAILFSAQAPDSAQHESLDRRGMWLDIFLYV